MTIFDYRFFHIASIIFFTFSIALNISRPRSSLYKALGGLSSLLLIISGLMLFPEIRISFEPPYPLWVWGKLIIWAILAIVFPVLTKRVPSIVGKTGLVVLALLLFAAYLAVFKVQ